MSLSSYEICSNNRPEPFVGGKVWLKHPRNNDCTRPVQFGSYSGNPLVQFDQEIHPLFQVELSDKAVRAMDVEYFSQRQPSPQRLVTTRVLIDPYCQLIMDPSDEEVSMPVVFGRYHSDFWIHDSRFVLQENSLTSPLADGGGTLVRGNEMLDNSDWASLSMSTPSSFGAVCANVPRSWLNEQSCFLSTRAHACSSRSGPVATDTSVGTVVCGSPGEVSNDLSLDGEASRGAFDVYTTKWHNTTRDLEARHIVWTTLALSAKDQLRQRMAWALGQILVRSPF